MNTIEDLSYIERLQKAVLEFYQDTLSYDYILIKFKYNLI